MFQQWLDLGHAPFKVLAGLHPTGGRRDPCVVKCAACSYHDTAPTWAAAVHLAIAHDRKHDNNKRRDHAKNDRD
jgi:hypothetical protein